MPQFQKTWIGAIAGCLMLQAGLLGFGLFVDRWFAPQRPCCSQSLVL